VLGVDELAVDGHVEHAAAADLELNLDAVFPVLGLQLGDQTGRLGAVVSGAAVLDMDLHRTT
jgi:hypothetical protein